MLIPIINFKQEIFEDPAELLKIYNAMNGTAYTNPDDLEIVTLENAVYMSMKNDVAFVVFYNGTMEQPERVEMKLKNCLISAEH